MIDRLLTSKQNDSAYTLLKEINIDKYYDDEIKACYWLYWLQAQHRLNISIKSVEPLDFSIHYFKESRDQEKLARAYYYKGTICEELGNNKDAVINLKQAERIVPSGKTKPWLTYAVYSVLAYLNNSNKDLAVYYGKKAIVYGYQLNDSANLVCDFINLAAAYNSSGQKDSTRHYVLKCEEMINALPMGQRAAFYCSMGVILKDTPEKAKEYFCKSIAIKPLPHAYKGLGRIYKSEGNKEKAYEMLQKASDASDLEVKISALKEIYEMRHADGDYKASSEIARHIAALKDTIEKTKQQEDLQGVQEQMNYQAKEERLQEKSNRYLMAAVVMVMLTVAVVLLSVMRHKKLRRIVVEATADITQRDEQIEQLTDSNMQKEKALHQQQDELEQQRQEMRKQQRNMDTRRSLYEKELSAGRLLYERLLNGETMATWEKKDLEHFINYYRIIDQPFMNSLAINYTDLSDRQIVFSILEHMGKSDEELARIMGISATTLRTTRYRIREKMLLRR